LGNPLEGAPWTDPQLVHGESPKSHLQILKIKTEKREKREEGVLREMIERRRNANKSHHKDKFFIS